MYTHKKQTSTQDTKNQISIPLLKNIENILLTGQFCIHFYKKEFNFQRQR